MVNKINRIKIIRFIIFSIITLCTIPVIDIIKTHGFVVAWGTEFKSYNIDTVINADGSADVKEQIEFKAQGDKRGIVVGLPFSDKPNINIDVTKVQWQGNDADYDYYAGSKKVKIYTSGMENRHTYIFNLEFHVPEMMLVTNEFDNGYARYYHQMLPSGQGEYIKNFSATFTFPTNIENYFVHGNYSKNKIEGNKLTINVPLIQKGRGLEVDIFTPLQGYDQSIIDKAKAYGLETTNREVKQAIDKELLNQNAARRDDMRKLIIRILITAIAFGLCIYIFKKRDPLVKVSDPGIVTQLPSRINPAVVDIIDGLGKDDVNFNLILLSLELKEAIIVHRDINNRPLSITIKNDHQAYGLDNIELAFIEELLDCEYSEYIETNGGKTISIEDLEIEASFDNTAKLVEDETHKVFKSKRGTTLSILKVGWFTVPGMIMLAISITLFFTRTTLFIIIVEIFVVAIYFGLATNITKPEVYLRWESYKNYLENYTFIKDKNIDSLFAWKQVLLYAIALDVNDNVVEALNEYAIQNNIIPMNYNFDIHLMYSSYGDNFGYFSSSSGGGFSGGSSSGDGGGFSGGGVSSF